MALTNGPLRLRLTARNHQILYGRPVYFPVFDPAKKVTTIGPLVIPHVGHSRFQPTRDFSKTPITETMLERLASMQRSYERGRFILINADFEARAVETVQLFADLACIDFFRMNGYSLATKGDFYGGKRAVPGKPGVFRDAIGFFPTVAENPSLGLIDQIGFCRADLLPGLLNGLLDFRQIKGRDDAGNPRHIDLNPRSFFVAINGPKDELINNELPPDTADRFRPSVFSPLPANEEKQLAQILSGLSPETIDLLFRLHTKMVEATKDGKNLEYSIRPFSIFDFHRLAQFTVLFKGYFEKQVGVSPAEALKRTIEVQAHDLYFRRIPTANDRQRVAKASGISLAPFPDFKPQFEDLDETMIDGKATRTRRMILGDAEILVYGADYINGIEETPFLLQHMRLAAKCRRAGETLVFRGPSGIGKSASAGHLLKKIGLDYGWQHFERDMGKAEVLGGYDLGEEAGQLTHFKAAILRTAESGTPMVGDEIDNLRSSGHALLFPLIDSGTITNTEGPDDLEKSIIKKRPGHWLFLTCNPVGFYKGKFYEGKSEIPRGLLQHTVEVFVDYADAAEEKAELTAILAPKFGGHSNAREMAEKMVGFYQEMSGVLLAQIDAASQAASFEQQQVADYMPTKRWLLEWQKGALALAKNGVELPHAVADEAVDEILSRFSMPDLQKIKPIFQKYFPQATARQAQSYRANALTPSDFAWAKENLKVPRTELFAGSLDAKSTDFQEGLGEYLKKNKSTLAGVLQKLAKAGGGSVEEATVVMAEEAALLARERPINLQHPFWQRHRDLNATEDNLPRVLEREVAYGLQFLTAPSADPKTEKSLDQQFAALVQVYLALSAIEKSLLVATSTVSNQSANGQTTATPTGYVITPLTSAEYLLIAMMSRRTEMMEGNELAKTGKGKKWFGEIFSQLRTFIQSEAINSLSAEERERQLETIRGDLSQGAPQWQREVALLASENLSDTRVQEMFAVYRAYAGHQKKIDRRVWGVLTSLLGKVGTVSFEELGGLYGRFQSDVVPFLTSPNAVSATATAPLDDARNKALALYLAATLYSKIIISRKPRAEKVKILGVVERLAAIIASARDYEKIEEIENALVPLFPRTGNYRLDLVQQHPELCSILSTRASHHEGQDSMVAKGEAIRKITQDALREIANAKFSQPAIKRIHNNWLVNLKDIEGD